MSKLTESEFSLQFGDEEKEDASFVVELDATDVVLTKRCVETGEMHRIQMVLSPHQAQSVSKALNMAAQIAHAKTRGW